jgi:preprotein translocase subunit SecG
MMILFWFLMAIFILVCVVICFLVLIQSDKGGGISGAIGGGLGGANSLLGTQDTANILTRGTVIFGGVFFVLCIVMSFVMSHQNVAVDKSLLQKRAEKQNSYSPASVLNNGGGLPIKQAEQGAPAGAGIPIQQQPASAVAPAAAATPAPQPQQVPKAIPAGALPIAPAKTPGNGKK